MKACEYYYSFLENDDIEIFKYYCKKKCRSTILTYVLWVFGIHYAYLKMPFDFIMFWSKVLFTALFCYVLDSDTIYIAFIWWIVSLFNLDYAIAQKNKEIARNVYYDFETGFKKIYKY